MEIEKGIPIPNRNKSDYSMSEILRKMAVGDSIVIEKKKSAGWRSSARSLGIRVATRPVSETETRLWRVAESSE